MKKAIIIFAVLLFSGSSLLAQDTGSQTWRHQFAFDFGAGIPAGYYTNAIDMETGINASLTYYLQMSGFRHLFLSAAIGFQQYDVAWGEDIRPNWDASYQVIPVRLGARYNFRLSGFQPYAGLEVGYYWWSHEVSYGQEGSAVSYNQESESQDPALMPKIGFRYPLKWGLDFDMNVKYHYMFRDEDATTDSKHDFQTIGINVGVAYIIGKD